MAIVRKQNRGGTVSFQVKLRDHAGKWFPARCFGTLAEAEAEEQALKAKKRKGALASGEDARTVSVSEFWEVWSEECRPNVSKGWRVSQDQMFRDYVSPVIGSTKLIDVGPPQIGWVLNRARSRDRRCKDGQISEQTRKHLYSLLRSMFRDAVEYYEMLDRSPILPKQHRPKVRQTERDFLHPEEAFQLLESCRDSYMGPPTWLMMLSAPRVSEVQGLLGSALDFRNGQILIRRAFNNKVGEMQEYPKHEDWSRVPMAPMLAEYLIGLGVGPDAFVAPGPKGGMLSYETYLRALARLCKKAGVPVVTPHELRHSSTEIWVGAGASQEEIRRLLNHAAGSSATARYIHRTDGRLSELGSRIGHLRVIDGGAAHVPSNVPSGEQRGVGPQVGGGHRVH
jgi:integrase